MYFAKRKGCRFFLVFAFLATIMISGCTPSTKVVTPPQGSQQELVNENLNLQEQVEENKQEMKQEEENIYTQEPLLPSKSNPAIPILYYHSIDYEEGNELRVPAAEFETHMQLLWQNGYECLTLEELYQYFYEGRILPEKPFVLTFDDGYEDNYLNAFPIANKYGYRGTVFMVTNWIDGKGYLKREQLVEMSQAGWQIESHTMSHPYLNGISTEQIKKELITSKQVLEELLQDQVTAFAYPYGVYDYSISELCKEAGYKMGLTTDRGWADSEDPFRIKRIYCYAQMGESELKRRIENQNY